jgi:hypothetical protein
LHLFLTLPTPELLPLTLISHHLSAIVLRILHNRLVATAQLDSHSLLLECYHPSVKLFEPGYFCAYRGTNGLAAYETNEELLDVAARLRDMRGMYSRFRPYQRELEEGGRRVAPRPGDVPGSRTFPGTVQDKFEGETVKQTLSLEAHELFTQLEAVANLVKIGPRHGLFTSFVDVEEGVIRVWREWLVAMAAQDREGSAGSRSEITAGKGKGKEVAEETSDLDDAGILWISNAYNTGIRFRVREKKLWRDAPILIRAEEDIPVNYEIEYDGRFVLGTCLLGI